MSIFRELFCTLFLACKANFVLMASGVILVMAFAMLLSAYFGGRQPATVALDVGFSTIRLLVPLLIVLLMQEVFSREFDKRYYLSSLTYPRSRSHFLFGRFVAALVLLSGLLLILYLSQAVLVGFISDVYPQATAVDTGQYFLVVCAFMSVDFLVITALATLLSVVASTPSFVLIGTFGFMLVARSYGYIIDLLSRDMSLVGNADGYRASLGILSYLLPDLGALDIRMLALYGKSEFLPVDWMWLVLSSLGYAVGLLALTVWALQRKRFA